MRYELTLPRARAALWAILILLIVQLVQVIAYRVLRPASLTTETGSLATVHLVYFSMSAIASLVRIGLYAWLLSACSGPARSALQLTVALAAAQFVWNYLSNVLEGYAGAWESEVLGSLVRYITLGMWIFAAAAWFASLKRIAEAVGRKLPVALIPILVVLMLASESLDMFVRVLERGPGDSSHFVKLRDGLTLAGHVVHYGLRAFWLVAVGLTLRAVSLGRSDRTTGEVFS